MKKKRSDHTPASSRSRLALCVYFLIFFCVLFILYRPAFSNPPRSDYWALFYHFQAYRSLPVFDRIIAIADYDIWGHGTYRPLFHLVLYWLYLIFGADYFWYHLTTFGLYCLSVLLMYRLGRACGCGRALTAAFLTVFAFLFSHFDIVTWTFHLALIAGFCLFLAGFLLFWRYLRKGRKIWLAGAVLLFLPGMLCYELFILWPLGMVILSFSSALLAAEPRTRRRARRAVLPALAALYLVYGAVIGFTRAYSPIEESGRAVGRLLAPSRINSTLAASSAAILFNGVVANIDPLLTSPVIIQDNIGRGGVFLKCSPALRSALSRRKTDRIMKLIEPPLIIEKEIDLDSLWQASGPALEKLIIVAGIISLLALAGGIFLLYRKERAGALPPFFFFFLLFTAVFTLYHGRMVTNVPLYVFRQFRYQYIPNALIALLALLLVDRWIRARPQHRIIPYVILFWILLINLLVVKVHLSILDRQMAPLGKILTEIRAGLKDGRISPARKLYLDDAIAAALPSLCWNTGMARFMKGTYQWIFSPRVQKSFTFDKNQAGWVIDKNDFNLKEISNSPVKALGP